MPAPVRYSASSPACSAMSAVKASYTPAATRMRRSLSRSRKALLQMRDEAAVAHHLEQVRRNGFEGMRLPGGLIDHQRFFEVQAQPVAIADALGLCADERRQAEVERVAVEQAGKRFGDQRGHAEVLQRRGRLLARGARAKVAAGHHDVARFYLFWKFGKNRLEAMLRDVLDAELHVLARRDDVGIDVVAEHPGPHGSISLGSHTCPATAVAATV